MKAPSQNTFTRQASGTAGAMTLRKRKKWRRYHQQPQGKAQPPQRRTRKEDGTNSREALPIRISKNRVCKASPVRFGIGEPDIDRPAHSKDLLRHNRKFSCLGV